MTDQKPSFWSTLPGILTAVAAILGATATLITALYSTGVIGTTSPRNQPAATPSGPSTTSTSASSFPESPESLRKYFEEMLNAAQAGNGSFANTLAQGLIVPNYRQWFVETFGQERGQRLALEYAILIKQADTPEGLFNLTELLQRERTPIEVIRVVDPSDPNATGLQKKALLVRQKPVALYTLKLRGISIWSFVYVDGAFRIAGKMRAINDDT